MDKFKVGVEGSSIVAGYDGNSDGENSVSLSLHLKEAMGELISKGEAKIEVKTLTIKRVGTSFVAALDTDKDGEAVLEFKADIMEAMQEAL